MELIQAHSAEHGSLAEELLSLLRRPLTITTSNGPCKFRALRMDLIAGASSASSAIPPSSGKAEPKRRIYKACQPCASKKVRCDLGDVDQPMQPPCKRCRREGDTCVFREGRRTQPGRKKQSSQASTSSVPVTSPPHSYAGLAHSIPPSASIEAPSFQRMPLPLPDLSQPPGHVATSSFSSASRAAAAPVPAMVTAPMMPSASVSVKASAIASADVQNSNDALVLLAQAAQSGSGKNKEDPLSEMRRSAQPADTRA